MNLSFSLPQNSTCLLKVGQKVDFETPFFAGRKSEDVTILIAEKMGIPPAKIFTYLKKFVGDTVKKGDILAAKKGLLTVF